jgi:hypothetical protein
MTEILENITLTTILYLFLIIIFIPSGHLLATKLLKNCPSEIQSAACFGFSFLLLGSLLSLLLALQLPLALIRVTIIFTVFFSLFFWIRDKHYLVFFTKDISLLLVLTLLFLFTFNLLSAHPKGDFRNISPNTTMELTKLPIDNLIPYNVSRYFLEELEPARIDVTPDWKITDRGPLGGIIFSIVRLTLGLEEKGNWLEPSAGLFWLYQTTLSLANLLSCWALFICGKYLFSRRVALLALLLFSSTSFFYLNTIFSWPKFLSAYLFVLGLFLLIHYGLRFIGGIFIGLAQLAHDSILFYIISLIFFLLIQNLIYRHNLLSKIKEESKLLCGLLLPILPWTIYKQLHPLGIPRLFIMHVLCIEQQDIAEISIPQALTKYWSSHTLAELLEVRLFNLLYPWNPLPFFQQLSSHLSSVSKFMIFYNDASFFQLWCGVGPITYLLFLASLFFLIASPILNRSFIKMPFIKMLGITLGAILPVALILSCRASSVSHQWAYSAFLLVILGAASAIPRLGVIGKLLLAISLGINLFFAITLFVFYSKLELIIYASQSILLCAGFLIALIYLMLLSELFLDRTANHHEN